MAVREAANVRVGPSIDTPRRSVLYPGDQVVAVPSSKHWLAVIRPAAEGEASSPLGYVFAYLLEDVPGKGNANPEKVAGPPPREKPRMVSSLQGLEVTPAIEMHWGWDDNIFFKGDSGWEFLVAPSIEVGREGDRSAVTLRVDLDSYSYPGNDDYDRINQNFILDGSYKLSSRVSTFASAGALFDSAFESALEESGTVVDKQDRHVLNASAGIKARPGDRDSMVISCEARTIRHEKTDDYDRSEFGMGLNWRHELNQRVAAIAEAQSKRYEYQHGSQQVHMATAGLNYKASDSLSLSGRAGGYVSQAAFDPPGGRAVRERSADTTASASTVWKMERNALEVSLGLEPMGSTHGENIRRTVVRAQLIRELTDRLAAKAGASVNNSGTVGYIAHKRNRAVNLSAELHYRIDEHARATVGYLHTSTKDRGTDQEKERNQLFIGFAWAFPQ